MRFVELTAFGIDHLAVREKAEPSPGPGQVLVRVRACSLNFRDLRMVQGQYDPRMPMPRVPLSDGAGEVAATGPGVSRWKVGDRVTAIFMQSWIGGEVTEQHGKSALGGAIDGMLSEYVVLSEEGLVATPEHLSDQEAATLPCTGVTTWNALMVQGRLRAGETVLVQGTGGVSIYALQLARLAGAEVITTSSSDEKLARAQELGASAGINYRTTPDWGRRVREITGKRGVDHIVEVGGSGTLNQSMVAARVGGHIAVIGVLGGIGGEITTAYIMQKSLRISGIYVGSREMFESLNRAVSLHRMRPVIDRVFPMTEIQEAMHYMESGAHFGKVVIRLD